MYRIWWKTFFDDDKVTYSVSAKCYRTEVGAKIAARRLLKDHGRLRYEWVVSITNPWGGENDD